MAFEKAAESQTATSGIPANKKAVGFLNLYLPTEGGGKRKVGVSGIPLRESNVNEKNLAAWIAEDPEARCKILLSKMIMEFNSAEPAEGGGFDLS